MVIRCIGSCGVWRPAWKAGWKLIPRMAGCRIANSMILPTSCSLTPRSMAGTIVTLRPICGQPVERAKFFVQDVRLAAKDSIGLRIEAVELEIKRRPDLVELFQKPVVLGDPLAVRVDHDEGNVAGLRGSHELDDLRMNGRLAARELDHLGIAFGAHVIVENLLHFFQGQAESWTGIGEAQRTIHVAGAVHFDDAQAGVLLMIRAQSAVVRTAVVDFAR